MNISHKQNIMAPSNNLWPLQDFQMKEQKINQGLKAVVDVD